MTRIGITLFLLAALTTPVRSAEPRTKSAQQRFMVRVPSSVAIESPAFAPNEANDVTTADSAVNGEAKFNVTATGQTGLIVRIESRSVPSVDSNNTQLINSNLGLRLAGRRRSAWSVDHPSVDGSVQASCDRPASTTFVLSMDRRRSRDDAGHAVEIVTTIVPRD